MGKENKKKNTKVKAVKELEKKGPKKKTKEGVLKKNASKDTKVKVENDTKELTNKEAKEEQKKVTVTKKSTPKSTKVKKIENNDLKKGAMKTVKTKAIKTKKEAPKKSTTKKIKALPKKDIKKKINIKKFSKKDIIFIITEALFVVLIIFSLVKIIGWMVDNNKNKDALDESMKCFMVIKKDGKEEYKVDFEGLKKQNSDVVAWIKVEGTKVNYPVVKTSDNDYYISHNLDKDYSDAGWIFADYKNNVDGNDRNLVIYGHGRLDGSMFGSLRDTLNENWQNNEENRFIKLFIEGAGLTYQVFSTYKIKVEDYYINTYLDDDYEYLDFLNTIKSRSYYDYGVDVGIEDKILTLSTCDIQDNYRIVVHAKKVVNN